MADSIPASNLLGENDVKELGADNLMLYGGEFSDDFYTICEKHHLLSEFTVYYWIWKNIIPSHHPKYVGIFHYRTFLNLKSNGTLDDDFLTRKGITEANIKAPLGRTPKQKDVCDAIITDVDYESWYSVDWKKAKITIRKQYDNCHPLGSTLFPTAIDFLKNGVSNIRIFNLFLPGIGGYAEKYFNDPKAKPYFKSVFVSTINYFSVYMEYLFIVLNYLMDNESVKKELDKLTEKDQPCLAMERSIIHHDHSVSRKCGKKLFFKPKLKQVAIHRARVFKRCDYSRHT